MPFFMKKLPKTFDSTTITAKAHVFQRSLVASEDIRD
jgi:hypothetical protein